MSRRDTIIVAVLINAGLLIVLFTTALKSGDAEEVLATNPETSMTSSVAPTELVLQKEGAQMPTDEVDQVLNQYAASQTPSALPATASSSSLPLTAQEQKTAAAVNFVEDLKAITMNEGAALSPSLSLPQGPMAAPSFAEESCMTTVSEVKVKKGDVLEKLAKAHGTSVAEIMKLNHLANTRLRIGQVLKMPAKGAVKATTQFAVNAEGGSTPQYYTVKNGDNPWTIAMKNHLKLEELLKLNNLNEEKARRLKAGDQLRIR